MKKIIVLILLVALLFPSITVFSEDGSSDTGNTPSSSGAPYTSPFDILSYTDGTEVRYCEDHIAFDIKQASSSVLFAAQKKDFDKYSNSLKFVIENLSECRSLNLRIYYTVNGVRATANKWLEIETSQEKKTYFVDFDEFDISCIDEINVTFWGVQSGTINIYSFSDIYLYRDGYEDPIPNTNVRCHFDYDKYLVHFTGSIGHTIYNNYRNATIEIYRTEAGVDVIKVDPSELPEPVHTSSMQIEFDIEVKVNDLSEAFSQYSMVINDGVNGRKFLCTPIIPGMSQNESDDYKSIGFKGVFSDVTVDAIDVNPLTVTVNIDLGKLESNDGSGYYFDIDGKYYYFSREYFLDLDSKMESYSKSNCNIYLKFDFSDSGNNAEQYSKNNPMFRRDLFAYTYYLIQRYGAKNNIVGIVVGDRADRFRCSTPADVASYMNIYSTCLFVISEAVKKSEVPIRVIVPISDVASDKNFDGNGYNSEAFLCAVAYKIENGFSNFGMFYIRLCSDFSPASFSESKERCVLNSPTSQKRYAARNITDFEAVLSGVYGRYSCVSDEYYFSWEVSDLSGSALSASYIYNFLKLYFDSNAKNFTVSFYESEKSKKMSVFSDLKHIIKYIDTEKFSEITDIMLSSFGVDSEKELIDNFNINRFPDSRLSEVTFEKIPIGTKGNYYIWNFSEKKDTDSWTAVNGCRLLSVESSDFGKCLVAKMQKQSALSGEYASIICSFDKLFDLSYSDFLTCTLGIDCEIDPNAVFEVMIVFGFENGVTEAKKIIEGGRVFDLTVNTNGFDKLSYLQVNVKPVSNQEVPYDLCISNIYESSLRYSDDELSEYASKYSGDNSKDDSSYGTFISYKEIIWLCVILALIVAAFVIILKKVDRRVK